MHVLLFRYRMKRETEGIVSDSLCNFPQIIGQARRWVQHRKIRVEAFVLGHRCHRVF